MSLSRFSFWFFVLWMVGSGGVVSGLPWIYVVLGSVLVGVSFLFWGVWTANRIWYWKAMYCACVICGAAYATLFIPAQTNNTQEIQYGDEQTIEGKVISSPRSAQATQSFILETKEGQKFSIRTPAVYRVAYGDHMRVTGVIDQLSTSTQYLEREGVGGVVSFARVDEQTSGTRFSVLRVLYEARDAVSQALHRVLGGDSAALANGLLLGQQSANFSPSFKNDMKQSGTTHLVALSGYNIAIVVQVLYGIVSWWLSRKKSFAVVMGGVILFVLMTGAESSVVRAAIMGSLVLIAQRLSRVYDFKQAMAATAWVMTLGDPSILLFDIGFVLSFVSLWGLAYIAPIIKNVIERVTWIPQWFVEAGSQTIGAQIAVAPLLIYWFGSISWTGIMTNIVLLPLVPLAMGVSAVVGLVTMIFIPLGWLSSFILAPILSFFIWVIHLGAQGGVVQTTFPWWALILCYVALGGMGIKYQQAHRHTHAEIRL